jgi:hypothetical protein
MAILINQRFPSCTLCGKMLPLRSEPIVRDTHRLCSPSCLKLLLKRETEAAKPILGGLATPVFP